MRTVALVDDHQLFRDGLKAILSNTGELEVIAETASSRDALSMVETKRPDLAIIDIALPSADGLSLARELVRRAFSKVVVLTMYNREEFVREALAFGARGYALKEQSALEIVDALRFVLRGQTYVAPRLRHCLDAPAPDKQLKLGPLGLLSPREREVFRLIVRGLSNDGIASELTISKKTVETHRAHINAKLNVHSTAQIVRFAAKNGLLVD